MVAQGQQVARRDLLGELVLCRGTGLGIILLVWKAKRSLREYLVLSLCAGYALLSSGCAASPETAAPAALATFTPCEQPRPAWRNPDSYRPAMVPAWADDVDGVESPTFYRIEAYVDIAGQPPRVYAIQQTSYTNRSDVPMGALYFRLFPNKPSYGTALTFEEIAIGGQKVAVEYEVERTALRVVMPNTLRPGESVNVRMQYDVTIPVDNIRGYGTFNFQDGILLLSNFYPMVAVYEDGRWNLSLAPDYGDPVYAETSFYSVDLTVPRDLIVVTSGSTVSTHDNEDGTSTWSSLSGPMRDFMVVIGQRLESSSLAVGFVRVNSHYFPEHKSGGEEVLEYARDCLRAYQQTFGAYPFAEFDVVEAPVIAGGMEYPGLVMLGGSYYENGGEVFEFLTAHEVAEVRVGSA